MTAVVTGWAALGPLAIAACTAVFAAVGIALRSKP